MGFALGPRAQAAGYRLAAFERTGSTNTEAIERATDRHMRVMARALLDGYPVGQLQSHFPNVALLVDQVVPRFGDEQEGRLAAANAVALQLGWRLFEPFLRSATGLDDVSKDVVRDAVAGQIGRMLRPE